jgi:amino acid transporter
MSRHNFPLWVSVHHVYLQSRNWSNCLIRCLNVFAVRAYGESEFWLSTGKILLILIVFSFTFVTMVGGNPQHDAYGSRYWNNPGAFAEYRSTGSLGRFEAYLAVLFNASFTIVGPEYISMVAAEARHPRIYIKNAFKTIYLRFALFFIGSAFAVGIVVPYNSKELALVLSGSTDSGTAGASPYVIAMSNMGITVLPHIVNALLLTSIFSAGNTYFFAASRALYGLSLQGRAPKFLRTCTKQGIPIYCLVVVVLFSFLSLLQLSHGSAVVLGWLINLVTGAMLVSYVVMSVTYICFHRACRAQGFDRSKLPYIGWFQPYSAYIAMIAQGSIALCYGYTAFLPWDVGSFFIYYAMIILSVLLFIGWKLAKKTTWKHPMDVDLVWDDPKISAYELACTDTPTGFWREILEFVRVDGKLKRQA